MAIIHFLRALVSNGGCLTQKYSYNKYGKMILQKSLEYKYIKNNELKYCITKKGRKEVKDFDSY